MKLGPTKNSASKLITGSKQSATLLESVKPKGFPTSGSKRLQPIKALDFKANEISATSPLPQATAEAKANDTMGMTQPSGTDSASRLLPADKAYKSATDFGAKAAYGPQMLPRNNSKARLGGKGGASNGRATESGSMRRDPLPSIDHTKQIDKLQKLTERSDDMGATVTSADSVQFSKPKIGVRTRESSSMTTTSLKKNKVFSKPEL